MIDRDIESGSATEILTTDLDLIQVEAAYELLKSMPWVDGMALETLERAMANSLCFGALRDGRLIGFARVVTDRTTYAYLTDVVIAAEFRGQGIGSRLIQSVLDHPELQNLRRVSLLTRYGVSFYSDLGFTTGSGALTYMERRVSPPERI